MSNATYSHSSKSVSYTHLIDGKLHTDHSGGSYQDGIFRNSQTLRGRLRRLQTVSLPFRSGTRIGDSRIYHDGLSIRGTGYDLLIPFYRSRLYDVRRKCSRCLTRLLTVYPVSYTHLAAILISIIARYGMQGVFTATLIAGILLVLCGIFHIGRLTSFIPAPVITGFTSGIAVIIALGQIDNFFGVTSEGSSAVMKLLSYGHLGFPVNIQAAGLGLFVVLFMVFFPKKWNAVVPASFLSIILATILSVSLKLDIQTVGAIPKTLFLDTRLDLAAITPANLSGLIGPAVSIAMLGMSESLLCGASAGKMANVRLNSDQELVAQGIGNRCV